MADEVVQDRQHLEAHKKKFGEEKKWEEKKVKIDSTLHSQKVVLDIGGTHYSTSCSTLTKYPDSLLGVMFSGNHDLDSMKSSDGSFFIDRDGARFKYILDYLRDGKEVVESFPKSHEELLGLLREAKYYQLEGLVSALGPQLREVDVITQKQILVHFITFTTGCHSAPCAYSHEMVYCTHYSIRAVSYKHKNMRGLFFDGIKFECPVTFIGCDLSLASFTRCIFSSHVIFQNCILDDTTFFRVNGLVTVAGKKITHNVSFAGSKTNMTNFEDKLRKALVSDGKIK